jgi:uncharacterized protein
MNVLITGSSGLLGSALIPSLTAAGHRVTRLVRSQRSRKEGDVYWNPEVGLLDPVALEAIDAAVHLAGESIAARWTAEKKTRILQSRVASTRLLAERLGQIQDRPKVFVCASAIGYYGDRGDQILTEESAPGSGFLYDVCRQWEAATGLAEERGIRTVRLRIGVVLSKTGGALAKMLPPFRMGLGGRLGAGTQYMSWIAIDDLVGSVHHALATDALRGAVNAVAPNPVTNLEFTKTLGKVLRRPTIFPVPALAVRLLFGEMGQELLLGSTRVEPRRLQESGYGFRHLTLEKALRAVLG